MEMPKLRKSENLQAHHIESRSRLGDDAIENMITLCADCHRAAHINDIG